VRNYLDTQQADNDLLEAVNIALLKRGVLKSDTKFYLCTMHSEDDINATAAAYAEALTEVMDHRSAN
jgi:glutamate-1-semialdehyde aminotransferase